MPIVDKLARMFEDSPERKRRTKANRDKMVLRGPGKLNDRFYLTPVGNNWGFVLYSTTIVTVHPDDTATINLGGWYSTITFVHLRIVLHKLTHNYPHIKWDRPNKWTQGRYLINGTLLFDGLRLNLATNEWINPKPAPILVPDWDRPEVKDIRRNLTVVKQRYQQIAQLHALSLKNRTDPFEEVKCTARTYEQLTAETEPTNETYRWLARGHSMGAVYNHSWAKGRVYGARDPLNALENRLQAMKNELYSNFLVERS